MLTPVEKCYLPTVIFSLSLRFLPLILYDIMLNNVKETLNTYFSTLRKLIIPVKYFFIYLKGGIPLKDDREISMLD